MRVYTDTCVLSRLTDDRTDSRIRSEALAIERVFKLIVVDRVVWLPSSVLVAELQQISDTSKRDEALAILDFGPEVFLPDAFAIERAAYLFTLGYGRIDALHLACAEMAKADILLTTDDRFLRQVTRGLGAPKVRAANPVDWLREVLDDDD